MIKKMVNIFYQDLKYKFFCALSKTLKDRLKGKNVLLFGVKAFETFWMELSIIFSDQISKATCL